MPSRFLLRYDRAVGVDWFVCSGVVRCCGLIGVQQLRRWLLLGCIRWVVLGLPIGLVLIRLISSMLIMRIRPVPSLFRSEQLFVVPCGELLRHNRVVGSDGRLRGGLVFLRGLVGMLQLYRGPILRHSWSGLGHRILRRRIVLRCRRDRMLELLGRYLFGGWFGRVLELLGG